jgi:signal transduction histidine kinase
MTALVAGDDVELASASSGAAALGLLAEQDFDCVVLAFELPDMDALDLIERARDMQDRAFVPFVVYAENHFGEGDQQRLRATTRHSVVTLAHSRERLLDETSLFLHRDVSRLPEAKLQMVLSLQEGDAVLADKKILVVDDDVRNIFALSSVLERYNMKVIAAHTGLDAIRLLEQTPDISLVLLDIMMPEMDGYETMRRIRGKSQFQLPADHHAHREGDEGRPREVPRSGCLGLHREAGRQRAPFVAATCMAAALSGQLRVSPAAGERANILLVDDTPARLLTYEAILGSLGHNLVRAQSGNEALVKLLEMEVATILLDVSMPGMDGFETAAMIRGHPRSAQTPIIFVTGVHLTDLDRLRGYEMGAVDYVSVPVIPEILRGKVSVLVQLYLQRRELSRLKRGNGGSEHEARGRARSAQGRQHARAAESESHARARQRADARRDRGTQTRESLLQHEARRKDEFLAILAHELRNPLSAMHNAVQLMHAANLGSERVDWVRDLLDRQLKHLTRLIDDLLDVRRITSGSVRLQREPLDLESVLRQSVEAVRSLIDARRHTVAVRFAKDSLYVEGDLVRLTQVFINLLANAAKYTPEGGRIEVTLAVDAEDGRWSLVRVRDTGAGIPNDMLERVFELFAQANAAETRTHSGLGIGLSLVRGLVALHGGAVWATATARDAAANSSSACRCSTRFPEWAPTRPSGRKQCSCRR